MSNSQTAPQYNISTGGFVHSVAANEYFTEVTNEARPDYAVYARGYRDNEIHDVLLTFGNLKRCAIAYVDSLKQELFLNPEIDTDSLSSVIGFYYKKYR